MGSKKDRSNLDEKKNKVKSQLYKEEIIETLQEEFDLSEIVKDAAILIFRLFAGLGKGLTESQRKSFSTASIWYAARVTEGKKINKEELAKAVDISSRTLTRRFNEIEEDEETKLVLDYVRKRIKKWSKERDKRLQKLL